MLGLFKKKTEKQILEEKYTKLLKESYDLSKSDRQASDKKIAEANEIAKQIDQLSMSQK